MSLWLKFARANVRTDFCFLLMTSLYGVPRTLPEARVSPIPKASSTYTSSGSRVRGLVVIMTNDISAVIISCTRTAMCAASCGIEACLLLSVARRVQREDHTHRMALATAVGVLATLARESYRPAPEISSRSSTLALDLSMRRADGPNEELISLTTTAGTSTLSSRLRISVAMSGTVSTGAVDTFLSSAAYVALSGDAATASSITPKGTARPGGSLNAASPFDSTAIALSLRAPSALAPPVDDVTWGKVKRHGLPCKVASGNLTCLGAEAASAAAGFLGATEDACPPLVQLQEESADTDKVTSPGFEPSESLRRLSASESSSIVAKTTPSCRARTPKCDRCGSS
mmetsp:Transcript_41115/g.66656  ORF Transcript_41115/g.66656 Transcript_41115/m.66656 type:complete len:344 (+) Transcript_41115:759-1790(+)